MTAKIAAKVVEKMTKDGTGRMTQEELELSRDLKVSLGRWETASRSFAF